jgi:hypothetical protein
MKFTCAPPVAVVFVLALGAALSSIPAPAAAATFRVDDSASLPREGSAVLAWRDKVPTRDGNDALEGTTSILFRLDVAAWMNRTARLYLVLPQQAAPITRLQWRTQGRLQPGQALPGQRVLVYQGPIQSPLLEERLDLVIEASGTRLQGMQSLNLFFEIDLD